MRRVTFEELATSGKCPVCHADDGEACRGKLPDNAAHVRRIVRARREVAMATKH